MKQNMPAAFNKLQLRLDKQKEAGLLRSLPDPITGLIDFCSNDYLGLARCQQLRNKLLAQNHRAGFPLGSTGSRLLSGNTHFAEKLEADIAIWQGVEKALLFSTGYTANIALFSCLPGKGDTIIMDEYIHASVIDGYKMGLANRLKFKHNNLDSLESMLKIAKEICYVAIESVYSMDGSIAPLQKICQLCHKYTALLIVDEAHAFGVFGKGLVHKKGLQSQVFACLITFGKALAAHGAAVLGSKFVHNYLVNFARPFIYSTAMQVAQLQHIRVAYEYLHEKQDLQQALFRNIALFKSCIQSIPKLAISVQKSPIQSVIIPGNEQVQKASEQLKAKGFAVLPIRSPTVPAGKERLRITLHVHNTVAQIKKICSELGKILTKKIT